MKRNSTKQRARRGVALLVTLLLTAVLIFNLDLVVDLFRGYVDVVAVVPEASGIRVGSPVWVEGVEAGRVTAVDIMDLGDRAVVALHVRLEDRVRTVVRRGSRAYAMRRRFIGEPTVRISAGPAGSPPIETGDTLQSLDRVVLTELLRQGQAFPAALDSLTTALGRLEQLASDRRPELRALVDRFTEAAGEAQTLRADLGEGSVGRWLRDPEMSDQIRRLGQRVSALSEAAQGLERRYGDPELNRSMGALSDRAGGLGIALDELEQQLAQSDGFLPRAARDSALAVAIRGVQAQIDSLSAAGMGFALRMLLP